MAAICDEYEGHQDSTGQPVILVGQSIVLGEIKAEVPAHDEEPRDDQIILQQYVQQVESLSPENRLSKFCKEAGFMRVVEVGQLLNQKGGSEETRELDLSWKSQRASSTSSTESKFELNP